MKRNKIIDYLDGFSLKQSILSSARKIDQHKNVLDEINVFPVPDGDTGANMAETMQVIANGVESRDHEDFDAMSDTIADLALEGARGNSGVILAQFFQGLAEQARGRKRVATQDFASIVETAVNNAEAAVSNPKEGTILTVMRDWANHVKEYASRETNFVELLRNALQRAKESLAETPQKLKALRHAGVVDAGAQGFVHLLEGIQDVLETGKQAAISAGVHMAHKIGHHSHSEEEAARYQYCTQCLIEGQDIDKSALRDQLASLGDSLIVIGSHKKARVHVHSNDPEQVFRICATFGDIVQQKREDMRAQSRKRAQKHHLVGDIAIVTDSTCDLPREMLEENHVFVVPVSIRIDNASYVDKVDLQPEEFYEIFKNSNKVSTSQPTLGAFKKVYEKAAAEYRSIISIHLSGHISGTINGARLALQSLKEKRPFAVIDSKATSVGLGLIVKEAIDLVKQELPFDEVVQALQERVKHLRLFASLPAFSHAIKSGRIPKAKGLMALLLNIRPVVTFDSLGKVTDAAKVIGSKNVPARLFKEAVTYAQGLTRQRFGVTHAASPELANHYAEKLAAMFGKENVYVIPASPALGAQLGIGAFGIAVLGDPK